MDRPPRDATGGLAVNSAKTWVPFLAVLLSLLCDQEAASAQACWGLPIHRSELSLALELGNRGGGATAHLNAESPLSVTGTLLFLDISDSEVSFVGSGPSGQLIITRLVNDSYIGARARVGWELVDAPFSVCGGIGATHSRAGAVLQTLCLNQFGLSCDISSEDLPGHTRINPTASDLSCRHGQATR